MTMRYTFWHGRTNRKSDVDWLGDAERALQNNEWTTPLYVDGAGWIMDAIREEAAIRLFRALGENSSASTLIFQNATLERPVIDAFERAMEQNRNLRSITIRNLSTTSTQQGALYSIPASAFLNPELESLTLVKASLDKQGCKNLSRLIRDSNTLTSVALEAVQMDDEGLVSMLAAIIMSRSVRSLRLNKLEWNKTDIRRFLMAASNNKSITNLCFEGMNLDITDARLIAKVLQKNKTIQQLSLRKNNINAKSLEVLVSEGLLKNATLEKLFLSRNFLGDKSAPHICKLLAESTTLRELCLVDTKIEMDGCREIARALRYNTGLTSLSMDGNSFEGCAQEMLDSLEHNTHLERCLDRLPAILARRKQEFRAWQQVDFYLRANKARRGLLRLDNLQPGHVPYLWENATARPDILFYFIRSSGNHFPQADPRRDPTAPPRAFVPSRANVGISVPLLSAKEANAIAASLKRPSAAPSA